MGIHRYQSTPMPRDAPHHQKQASLRNSGSVASAVWVFLQLAWTWRRSTPIGRTLPIIICDVLSVVAFAIAGGLSSRIASGIDNEVLLDGANCGIVNPTIDDDTEGWGSLFTYEVLKIKNAASYAQQCYNNGTKLFDCTSFIKKHLPGTTEPNAPCPFQDHMCRSKSNLRLDTGYIDSSEHLGINWPRRGRISYRMVLHCAPLVTERHSDNTRANNRTRYYYGPYMYRDYTYEVNALDIQYNLPPDSFGALDARNFELV